MSNSVAILRYRETLEMVRTVTSRLGDRRGLVLGAALAVAIAVVCFFAGPVWTEEESFTTESMTFATNVVPDTTNDEDVDIEATLYIPKHAKFPISAVIIAPSSSGIEDEREIYYAKELVKAGMAALVIDSFTPRGLTDSVYDQSLLEAWDIENDAIAAFQELAADKRIKPNRIAIVSFQRRLGCHEYCAHGQAEVDGRRRCQVRGPRRDFTRLHMDDTSSQHNRCPHVLHAGRTR